MTARHATERSGERLLRDALTSFATTMLVDASVGKVAEALLTTAVGLTDAESGAVTVHVGDQGRPMTVTHPLRVGVHLDLAALDPALAGDVLTLPLRWRDEVLGAVTLYRAVPRPLQVAARSRLDVFIDVASAYVANAQARQRALATSTAHENRSLRDPLTGLPNRALLEERIESSARRARRSHSRSAVLFADLDRFKEVNDRHGHAVGDALLVAVAGRLQELVRGDDTLARVSGDEFVVLCENLAYDAAAVDLAERIRQAFTQPFHLADVALRASISIGIAYSGPGESLSQELVGVADQQMYLVKLAGRTRLPRQTRRS